MYVYLVNDIKALLEIDWIGFAIALLALMGAFVGICKLGSEVLAWIGKPVGWAKQRKEDHEMVLKNAQAIKDLAELHKKDTKCVNEHEDKLREDLCAFMIEVRTDIKQFTDNRVHDRQQSLGIQKELTDSIKEIVNSQKTRDEQITALMCGSKELLGNTIDERYEKYINLGGIPQNEVDEFDSIYEAYKGLNGNHGRETKYEYVKEHLPVIPVKTELIRK